ncbi:MAG: ABC transporter substrate-binding protein [Thermodesulfobacteriota bacterium]
MTGNTFSSPLVYPGLHLLRRALIVLQLLLVFAAPALAGSPVRIAVSVPGPHNLQFLPADLIRKIEADKAEGAEVTILHVGGGSGALRELNTRNSDFAILALPGIMSQKANGIDVVAIAAVNDKPIWSLMVRADLQEEIRSIADLRGRTIGVTTSSATIRTVTQQILELLLADAGVALPDVHLLSIGKNWQDQSASIKSGTVDAIMGDEPFASRLEQEGKVFILAHPAIPHLTPKLESLGFLYATLATRPDIIADRPEMAATMVRILQRTLAWIGSHSPAEVAAQLGPHDPEAEKAIRTCLARYPNLYSPDGHFSSRQLAETQAFFRSTATGPAARSLDIEALINDHWVGRKP